MKKLKIALLSGMLLFSFAAAYPVAPNDDHPGRGEEMSSGRNYHAIENQNRNRNRHKNGAVGAPLDGGLLALLGAAGVAYFTARKKRKA